MYNLLLVKENMTNDLQVKQETSLLLICEICEIYSNHSKTSSKSSHQLSISNQPPLTEMVTGICFIIFFQILTISGISAHVKLATTDCKLFLWSEAGGWREYRELDCYRTTTSCRLRLQKIVRYIFYFPQYCMQYIFNMSSKT